MKDIAERINKALGITESFELPDKLMEALMDDQKRKDLLESFADVTDYSYDWFTDYFQETSANRDAMKQDFTPKEICTMLPGFFDGEPKRIADVCAGTGGLTIGMWSRFPDAEFFCIELSKRAFPLLLFNLLIRKVKATVVNGDVLTEEIFEAYQTGDDLQKTEVHWSWLFGVHDAVVMNPPYSAHFDFNFDKNYTRWIYGTPPNQYADLGFVTVGLRLLNDKGMLAAILPHGVLFRGNKEEAIRKELQKQKLLKTVVGLPDKLFKNTQIPTLVLILEPGQDGILFIDGQGDYEKGGKQNRLLPEHIEKITKAYKERKEVEGYAHLATEKEIEDNGCNLNIPRYVSKYEEEEVIPLAQLAGEIVDIDNRIRESEKALMDMMKQLVGSTDEISKDLQTFIELLEKKQ